MYSHVVHIVVYKYIKKLILIQLFGKKQKQQVRI